MKLIMLGAPGAGKGSQAEVLSKRYEIPTISTGAIIRNAIKNGTEVGLKAKAIIEKGQLVPDEVVIGIIQERLSQDDCKNGFILDGFPRTLAQAAALDALSVGIDYAINIDVKDDVIIKRLSGRRECSGCGAIYHMVTKPSAKGDKCEKCNADLVRRSDDAPETIKSRLAVYHEQTEPLIEYYKGKGLLVTVDGSVSVADTTREVTNVLEG